MQNPLPSTWLTVTVKAKTSLRGWSWREKFVCWLKTPAFPTETLMYTSAPAVPAFCTSTASSKVKVISTRSPRLKVSVPSAGREVTLTSVMLRPRLDREDRERP